MLSVSEDGRVKHVGTHINHTVMAPSKREVMRAWELITTGMETERERDVIARALGLPTHGRAT